jgi:micrococcal nuclease
MGEKYMEIEMAKFAFTTTLKVIDGDTVETTGEKRARIRLFGIDAPEIGQRGGKAAAKRLKDLLGNARVRVEATGSKSYGRFVARIRHLDGRDIAAMMVSDGFAVSVPAFTNAYCRYQNLAKKLRRGLWSHGQTIECPASWRQA